MHTVVGVLRGGTSNEHEVSLLSGAAVLQNLPEEHFIARDIYIDRKGVWHERGRPVEPERVLRQLDVAFIPLHGGEGEGEIQKLFERFNIPYVGANPFHSFLAMHKVMSKVHAREEGLLTPAFFFAERREEGERVARQAIRAFHQPVVVKPVDWGSSIGTSIVGGYAPVLEAIEKLFEMGAQGVLVEELVRGREATVGVVEGLRGEELYALPVVEIIPPQGDFFSYDYKYSGLAREVCPGRFSRVETEELLRLARVMHRALGQRHFSRSDFIVSPKGIYYLETNSAAGVGLTKESLLPKSLAAVGVSLQDFFTHLVNLALAR